MFPQEQSSSTHQILHMQRSVKESRRVSVTQRIIQTEPEPTLTEQTRPLQAVNPRAHHEQLIWGQEHVNITNLLLQETTHTFGFYNLLELWPLTYLHSERLKKTFQLFWLFFTWFTPSSSFSPLITGVSFQRAVLGGPVTSLRAEVGVGLELLSACVAPSESLCRSQQNSFKLTAFTWLLISTSWKPAGLKVTSGQTFRSLCSKDFWF